jgi:outer membrane protein OmpA-like peptidoglycan-associated protein
MRVVLLPEADGKPSAVVITPNKGAPAVLDKPYAALDVSAEGQIANLRTESAESVAQRYPALEKALPVPPASTLLFAKPGSTDLTESSDRDLERLLTRLKDLPAPEITVVGHTDTMGSTDLNDRLSQNRADALRQRLIARGVPAERITAIGRGKRQLLVPTADQVDEPRNRRLEVIMR